MGAKQEHTVGRYTIRMERRGSVLLYDILTRGGQLVACGIDALSANEETALEGIADRLLGKENQCGQVSQLIN